MLSINDMLALAGLEDLPPEDKNSLLEAVYEQLQMTVGTRLAAKLDEAELAEFEGLMDNDDESGALQFLGEHTPDYKVVVEQVYGEMVAELKARREDILGAAGVDG
jgi:hypothetical protein